VLKKLGEESLNEKNAFFYEKVLANLFGFA